MTVEGLILPQVLLTEILMDNSVITIEGDIVLVKVNRSSGFYILIKDIFPDEIKKDWWNVTFYPLVPTSNFELKEVTWKLDDSQIRGAEFTLNKVYHQLIEVQFSNKKEVPHIPPAKEIGFFKTELIAESNDKKQKKTSKRKYLKLVE